MQKKLNKGDREFEFFADYYKLYQDYHTPEDADLYWNRLIKACSDFVNKYPGDYAERLTSAYMLSRQEIYKKTKK